jgi:octaprenyl-diphosphate synthase
MKALMDMTTGIGKWLSEELDAVSCVMSSHLQNKHSAVNDLCDELATYKGKMLRPSLVLLSWRAVSNCETVPKRVHTAAAVVELIHLATLVHDDVLDDADLRRGACTMNSLHGNETAVMLGDYLLSSAFHLCSTIKCPELNLLLGGVTNIMCAGEVVQLLHRNNVDLDLESYYQIIHDKTASLISCSCEVGGILGGGNGEDYCVLKGFGKSIGTAFQIKDDLLDLLAEKSTTGKPTGRDLEKGKLTLPVILMLNKHPELRSRVGVLMSENDRDSLRSMLESTESISAAFQTVHELVDSAITTVRETFTNEAASQLCTLAQFIKTPI